MFTLRVVNAFFDTEAKRLRQIGETIFCTPERASFLLAAKVKGDWQGPDHYVELVDASHRSDITKIGREIILSCEMLYKIGGIETFYRAFVEKYKNRNITIVVRTIDPKLAVELSEYADIIIDKPGMQYECSMLILNHWDVAHTIYGRCKANKIMHVIHGDWAELIKDKRFSQAKIEKKDDVTYVAVSKTAQAGLKKTFGISSIVAENPLLPKAEKPLTFLTLSRASEEKGIETIVEMARRFRNAGKKFIWILCGDLDEQRDDYYERPDWYAELDSFPELIRVKPGLNNKHLLNMADYLVQASKHESFCYSAREALQYGVPVILTNFTEAKHIANKSNGFIVKQDLSDLDVDKIFSEIPKVSGYKESQNNWDAIFAKH